LKAILCRPGGKKLLKKRIVAKMPPHKTYVEPMFGSGAVFFEKPLANKNILGDNDKELMAFYKKAQKKDKLTCDIRRNKGKWNRLKKKKNKSACDYAYVQKASFKCSGETFNPIGKGGSNSVQNFDKQVEKLKKAKLVTGDYKKTIKKYDSKDTLFYIDPPYHDVSCDYPDGSCNVTPKDVKKAVDGIKGKFILSYNKHPEVKKIFCGTGKKKYKCLTVNTRYTNNKLRDSKKQQRKELLIKNY